MKIIPCDYRRTVRVTVFLCVLNAAITQGMADEKVSLSASTVDTVSGNESGPASSQNDMNGFFQAQKDLVNHILVQAGIVIEDLSPEVKQALATPQTKSIEALMSFSKGLDFLDKSDYKSAKEAFAEAVKLDPEFQLAKTLDLATPDENNTPAEISRVAGELGMKKANSILQKVKANDNSGDELLGATFKKQSIEENKDFIKALSTYKSDSPAAKPKHMESLALTLSRSLTTLNILGETIVDRVNQSNMIDAAGNLALLPIGPATAPPSRTSIYESSPACQSDLCGFYAANLSRGVLSPAGASTSRSVTNLTPVNSPFVTTNGGVGIGTGTKVTIPQTNKFGYLQATASPSLAGISSFKDGETGTEKKSEDKPANLSSQAHAAYNDSAGRKVLETGQYYNKTSFSEFNVDYFLSADRIYFAEGIVTPLTDLNTLAQNSTDYKYTGIAAAAINLGKDNTLRSEFSEKGIFSATVNFRDKVVKDFYASIPTTNSGLLIESASTALNSNGSFDIKPGSVGNSFHIGDLSQFSNQKGRLSVPSATPLTEATQGAVAGRTFGRDAAAIGGVFGVGRANNNESWNAQGSFGGQRLTPSLPGR